MDGMSHCTPEICTITMCPLKIKIYLKIEIYNHQGRDACSVGGQPAKIPAQELVPATKI
jgi:hypothetical protein